MWDFFEHFLLIKAILDLAAILAPSAPYLGTQFSSKSIQTHIRFPPEKV
jgi:hypothetical protein